MVIVNADVDVDMDLYSGKLDTKDRRRSFDTVTCNGSHNHMGSVVGTILRSRFQTKS